MFNEILCVNFSVSKVTLRPFHRHFHVGSDWYCSANMVPVKQPDSDDERYKGTVCVTIVFLSWFY
jgi:hypothetical protein